VYDEITSACDEIIVAIQIQTGEGTRQTAVKVRVFVQFSKSDN
jgi:hypothetical protein